MPKHRFFVFMAFICLAFSLIVTLAFAGILNSPPVKVQISAYGSNEKSQRGLFTTDFIVPLYYPQDKNTLVFFNPKYAYTTPGADEINQGIGLRHIFNDAFILGINTFFDRRLARSGKWYSQAGLGLEYLSKPLDVRLNWYKPLTRPKVVDDGYEFGSTSLIYYQNKEEPLQGLDFEVGVPVFDKYTRTRLYLGGFFYQSRFSKDVNGFRARTETSLTKWFSLDTTFNSKVDGQTEFYGGARVILPFEWTKLFRKKSKQGSSTPVTTNSYLEERIFDRVVRDIDIQSKSSTAQSKAHDLVYVDNSNTSGTEDGSYAHPYSTIAAGVSNAFGDKYVYVRQGLSRSAIPTYYVPVDLTGHDNVVLWGSGYNGGFKGISTYGYPVLDGGNTGVVLTLANNNTIMGLDIQNGNYGVSLTNNGSNIMTAEIRNNIFSQHNIAGVYFRNNGSGGISGDILNNTFSANDTYDIHFCSDTFSHANITANISGNTLTDVWYKDWVFFGQAGLMPDGSIYIATVDINKDNINDISGEASTMGATNNGITRTLNSGLKVKIVYNYLTWDYIGFDDPGFDIHIGGVSVRSVNARDIDTSGNPNTLDATGLTTFTQDISGYSNKTVTIFTGNTVDSNYQSWAYIDQVNVE